MIIIVTDNDNYLSDMYLNELILTIVSIEIKTGDSRANRYNGVLSN